jgi:type III pantothenate kinase
VLLAIDIGNTNIVCGTFRGDALAAKWRLSTRPERTPDEYGLDCVQQCRLHGLEPAAFRAVAVASVVPALDAVVERMCRTYFQREPLFVNASNQNILRVDYRPPADAGADRIVNAAGAYRKHGGPLVVLDFGTATTLDAVSRDGIYLGGAIAPGIHLAAEALASRTARLPRVAFARPPQPIGRSTLESLQSGLYYGQLFLVEGLVGLYRESLGPGTRVIATGGLADAFGGDLPWVDAQEPDLTLEGLYYIYRSITDG